MRNIFRIPAIIIFLLASVSILSCKSTSEASGSVMKFNLKKGKTYDYDMNWDMNQTIAQQQMKMNMLAGYSLEVTDEKDDIKTIKTTYSRIKMGMDMGEMAITYDSNNPTNDTSTEQATVSTLLGKVMNSFIGKSFIMKVNPEGKILEVSGFDEIRKSISASLKDIPQGKNDQMTTMMVDQQMNDENIKKMFEQIFFIFPNKEVKLGDSWTKNVEIGGMFPFKTSNVYTVKSIEGNTVALGVNTTFTSTSELVNLEGKQTGSMLVDRKSGLVINAEFEQDMSTTTQGMIMNQKGKGKIVGKER